MTDFPQTQRREQKQRERELNISTSTVCREETLFSAIPAVNGFSNSFVWKNLYSEP